MKNKIDDFVKWCRSGKRDPLRLNRYNLLLEDNIHLDNGLKKLFKQYKLTSYISIENYLTPTTLLHCWIICLIDHYVSNNEWKLVPLNMEYLDAERLLRTIFHGQYHPTTDRVFFSITQEDKSNAIQKYFLDFISAYNMMIDERYRLSLDTIRNKINEASVDKIVEVIEPYGDKAYHRLMLKKDVNLIHEIRKLTEQLVQRNLLHIYTGYAGSGKSTQAVLNIPTGKCMAIARSNTVVMSLVNKLKNMRPDCNCVPKSIAAFNLTKDKDLIGYNFIVDEFSQWELHDLNTLYTILQSARLNYKHVYLLGDTKQMKGFISRGSLLEAYIHLITCFNGHRIDHPVMHRCRDSSYNQIMLNYIKSGNPRLLNEHIHSGSFDAITDEDFEMIVNAGIILTDCGVGKLKDQRGCAYANHLVLQYLAKQYNMHTTSIEDTIDQLLKNGVSIRLLAEQTMIINSSKFKNTEDAVEKFDYKLLRNERALLRYNQGKYTAILERHSSKDEQIMISKCDLTEILELFTLGYAITVTRAQGLEWDYVIYVQDSKYGTNFESFYVAMTRNRGECKCITANKLKQSAPQQTAYHFSIR